MSTTLLHTQLQVSGKGGPKMRVESSSRPLIRVHSPLQAPSPGLRLECDWCGRKSEEVVAKIKGQESGRWAGGCTVGHREDVALTLNKVGAIESFVQERDMTWLPF